MGSYKIWGKSPSFVWEIRQLLGEIGSDTNGKAEKRGLLVILLLSEASSHPIGMESVKSLLGDEEKGETTTKSLDFASSCPSLSFKQVWASLPFPIDPFRLFVLTNLFIFASYIGSASGVSEFASLEDSYWELLYARRFRAFVLPCIV